MTMVIGNPMSFDKDESLEKAQERFIKSIEGLHERYRAYAGFGSQKLEII
jgi:hypothetical protein